MSDQPWATVPTGWALRPLWTEFRRQKVLGSGSEELLSVYRDYGVIPKASRDDNFNKPSEDLTKYQRVSRGDLVVNKMKAWQGSLGISSFDGIVSPAYFVYKATGTINPRFVHYLLRSKEYADHMAAISSGIRPNQWDLDPVQFAVTPLLMPPPEQQRAIADYLDRETAQIDAFIAKNEELITLLTERRSSIVDGVLAGHGFYSPSSLVMGPACDLPRDWRIISLGAVLQQLTNGFVGPTRDLLVDEGVRYIQGTHIRGGRIDFDRRPFYVPEHWHSERPRIHLRDGDILIVQTGDIGKVAVVPPDFGPASCHALQIARVNPNVVDPHYLGAYLSSRLGYNQLVSRATGALHLHLEASIKSVPVVVPPMHDQIKIVSEVANETADIDSAMARASKLVSLSHERRAALISAAVTGKIEVGVAA